MPFCASCGAAVEGKFCPACGKPVAAGPGAAMDDNLAGALCYLLGVITGVLFLVLEPYSRKRNIRFHAFQSIFLNLTWFAVWIVLTIVGSIAGSLFPWGASVLFGVLSMLLWLAFVVVWILLMVKTYSGAIIVLPVIGPLAEKQAG